MKKILFLMSLFIAGGAFAAWNDQALINRSSYTKSNDTTVVVTTAAGGSSTLLTGGVFQGVVIGSNSAAGVATFFDSVGVAVSTIGIVSMNGSSSGAYYVPFEVRLSSGLTYTTSNNNGAGISIIYKVLKPF